MKSSTGSDAARASADVPPTSPDHQSTPPNSGTPAKFTKESLAQLGITLLPPSGLRFMIGMGSKSPSKP